MLRVSLLPLGDMHAPSMSRSLRFSIWAGERLCSQNPKDIKSSNVSFSCEVGFLRVNWWDGGRRKPSKGGLSSIICQGEGTTLAPEGLTRCWERDMKSGLHWSSSNSPFYQLLPLTRYIVFLNSLLEIRQRPAGESSTGGGRINEKMGRDNLAHCHQ